MRSKFVKIVSGGCLGRGPLSSAKKGRKSYPPEPSQEGSLSGDSTGFTFSLWSQKVSKMVTKSSRNGGPMLPPSHFFESCFEAPFWEALDHDIRTQFARVL